MNKKIITKILVVITMLGIMIASNTSFAYVGDGYTIDVPSTFSSSGGAVWAKSTGDSINIQTNSNPAGEGVSYTALNQTVESLKKAYSITVEKQELTTLNGYDCFHLVYSKTGINIEQYIVPTKTKIYVITLGGVSSDFLTSSEAKGMIESFKITNYEKPGSSTSTGTTGSGTGTTNTNNTTSNTTSNTLTNTDRDDDRNVSKNTAKIDYDDDDEEDDDDKKSSSKKKSSSDDEDKNWIIIAIIAGAAVLCVAIIGTVIAVVAAKNKNR